jgi:hypothetical protein
MNIVCILLVIAGIVLAIVLFGAGAVLERQDTRDSAKSVFAKPSADTGFCAPRDPCFSIRFDYGQLTSNLEVRCC